MSKQRKGACLSLILLITKCCHLAQVLSCQGLEGGLFWGMGEPLLPHPPVLLCRNKWVLRSNCRRPSLGTCCVSQTWLVIWITWGNFKKYRFLALPLGECDLVGLSPAFWFIKTITFWMILRKCWDKAFLIATVYMLFFYKGPDSKSFRLCRPYCLSCYSVKTIIDTK